MTAADDPRNIDGILQKSSVGMKEDQRQIHAQ
jgi:hypothetical protein